MRGAQRLERNWMRKIRRMVTQSGNTHMIATAEKKTDNLFINNI